VKYKVLREQNLKKLTDRVEYYINIGWQLFGGPTSYYSKTLKTQMYMQGIVKN
jgi:hypothetical protein